MRSRKAAVADRQLSLFPGKDSPTFSPFVTPPEVRERATGLTFVGRAWADGRVTCKGCEGRPPGSPGFYMHAFAGTGHDVPLGPCALCGAPVVGEDPREP